MCADRVRFQAQERLDLVDANALQALIYEYVGQAVGGIMGNSAGALTTIEYDTNENAGVYTISLKPFQYYWCQPELIAPVTRPDGTVREVPKRYSGLVVSFNPSDSGQVETIDWTFARNVWRDTAVAGDNDGPTLAEGVHGGTQPGGSYFLPILWARPFSLDTDIDARREWNIAAQSELPISMKTRTRIRTEFKFQMQRPEVDPADTNQNQYVPIARVAAWSYDTGTQNANGAYVPDSFYLAPIYVWDSYFENGDFQSQTNGQENHNVPEGWGASAFGAEDGAQSQSQTGIKPAFVGVSAGNIMEAAPFENDGSVMSNLARGHWLQSTKAATGSDGTALESRLDGTDATWPYPGSYYHRWDPTAGVDPITGTAHGAWADAGWLGLYEEGFRPEEYSMWRLGIPQVLTLIRRQLSLIMDSKTLTDNVTPAGLYYSFTTGGRPWYSAPNDIGGLAQHKAAISKLEHNVEDNYIHTTTHRRFESGEIPSEAIKGVTIAAAGYVEGASSTSAGVQDGFGVNIIGSANSEAGAYVDFELSGAIGDLNIVSINITPAPHPDAATSGIVQVGAGRGIPWYWAERLNATQFRVYGAQYMPEYLDGSTTLGQVGPSTSGQQIRLEYVHRSIVDTSYWRLETQGQNTVSWPDSDEGVGLGTWMDIGDLGVHFYKPWQEAETDFRFYFQVICERV